MSMNYDEGHSKTVYSVVWPQTEAVMRECFANHLDEMLVAHRAPHHKLQDAIGPDFARRWWKWSGLSSLSSDVWPEFYPTAGASEALREVINELGGGRGSLVVFDGEYEGYAAIAQGQGIDVHKINRTHWRQDWDRLSKSLNGPVQWWISEPSSIDGCWWPEFEQWLDVVSSHSLVEVWADFSYVGATPVSHQRSVSPQKLAGFVFSLSKPAGVYYRRIGGCFSRRPISGLWGNRWFKNIDSIFLGTQWMNNIERGQLPGIYRHHQEQIISDWNEASGSAWVASDVVMLAYSQHRPQEEHDDRYKRGDVYRVCLSPALHELVLRGQ